MVYPRFGGIMTNEEIVYIGEKEQQRYVSACLFALTKQPSVKIIARGKHIKKAIDVVARLLRKFTNAEYNVYIKNVLHNDRYISEINIEFKIKK